MARATTSIVKDLVYENLSISTTVYGTLDTSNKRYKAEYIDDAIISADIFIVMLLMKYKQDFLLKELYQFQTGVQSGDSVDQNWVVMSVTGGGSEPYNRRRLVEVSFDVFDELESGSIYSGTNSNYYCFKDGIFLCLNDLDSFAVEYIDLTHPTSLSTLKSPSGFEIVVADLATARLLMKRLDKPEESQFYLNSASTFLQNYGIPQSAVSEMVDTPA